MGIYVGILPESMAVQEINAQWYRALSALHARQENVSMNTTVNLLLQLRMESIPMRPLSADSALTEQKTLQASS